MTDDRDDAEFTDGDTLGEDVGDDDLPGTTGFPPLRPLGVEDPSRDVDDDVATRELRRAVDEPTQAPSFALVQEGSTEGLMDDESQELASAVDASESDLSPEEEAVHVIEESE